MLTRLSGLVVFIKGERGLYKGGRGVSLSAVIMPISTDVGECNVLYAYQANETDELSINPGDVIKIIDKYDTEWWQGELNGSVGIFPASYVEDA